MAANNPAPSPDRPAEGSAEPMGAAFRELHGRRLHGFALLLSLGDRAAAARLASEALAAGVERLDELRHPERAAAWLRRRVVEHTRVERTGRADGRALLELGADEPVVAGIAALDRLERAALIASAVERLDRRDVATIVGRDGHRLDRLLKRSRERYAEIHAGSAPDGAPEGPIVARVRALARRAMT